MKKIIFSASLLLNIFFIIVLAVSLTASAPSVSVSFRDPDERLEPRLAAALIVAAPGASKIVFNTVEITLHPGERALLQYSAVIRRKQANWIINTLYDHNLISVEPSEYGVLITAIEVGEAVLQTLTEDGIKDVALIAVIE